MLPCSGSTQRSDLEAHQDFSFFLTFLSKCWFCLWDPVWAFDWSSRGGGEIFLLALATHSPWSLSPPRCDCGCESTPGSRWPLPVLQGQQPVLASRMCRAKDERTPLRDAALILSLHPLGAPDKSQLPSPAERCRARAHTQPCPGFRQQCGQLSQLRTPDKPNSLFLLSSQAVFALCSL